MLRLNSLADLEAITSGRPVRGKNAPPWAGSPSKHKAQTCTADGIRFPSKKHMRHYLLLKDMQRGGEIRYFLREVAFDLIGNYDNGRLVRHFVDFAVCQNDGTFLYQEVKGRDLPQGKLKRIQTEALYNIKIQVI